MIAGYCWPQSLRANESTTVFCHADGDHARMQVIRKGANDLVVLERSIQVFDQPMTQDLAAVGCQWRPSTEINVDPSWSSGFYLVRFYYPGEQSAEAYFVVRSNEPTDALLVLSTSTWAAYNNWGGPSFYTGGNTSALQRPLPKGFLHKEDPRLHRIARYMDWTKDDARSFRQAGYSDWCMAGGWANWEMLFMQWAESHGFNLGYAISADLDQDSNLLDGYPAYLSVGHDEYWSTTMRDNVEAYIDHGGNAAFFSGNTSFWQARFEGNGTQLVSYKTAIEDDPLYDPTHAPQLSTMWSDPLIGRPESSMTGVSFTRGGYAHMPNAPRGTGGYQVWQPDHWAFQSLQLELGDSLGAPATVVGYECDGCALEYVDGRPVPIIAADGEHGTPAGFELLATAPARLWETHEAAGQLHESYIGELNWVAQRLGGADTQDNRKRFERGHAVVSTLR